MSDEKKHLYTGAWTLEIPDAPRRQFGLVDASSPLKDPGYVRISIDTRQVEVRAQGPFLGIKLPEAWASVLQSQTEGVVVRARHLRELHKAGMLAETALPDDPPFNPPLDEHDAREIDEVKTRADLAAYVRALAAELRSGEKSWENANLQSFLDALAAWTMDMEGLYENRGEAVPEQPSWKLVAELLRAATLYE
jgi:hypothetical protein